MQENMSRASSRLRRFTLQSKNVTDNEYLRQLDGGKSMAEKNQWFFEIAWEVANQGTCTIIMPSCATSIGPREIWKCEVE